MHSSSIWQPEPGLSRVNRTLFSPASFALSFAIKAFGSKHSLCRESDRYKEHLLCWVIWVCAMPQTTCGWALSFLLCTHHFKPSLMSASLILSREENITWVCASAAGASQRLWECECWEQGREFKEDFKMRNSLFSASAALAGQPDASKEIKSHWISVRDMSMDGGWPVPGTTSNSYKSWMFPDLSF